MFDKDNDGYITAEELKEAMQTLGDRLTDKEVLVNITVSET